MPARTLDPEGGGSLCGLRPLYSFFFVVRKRWVQQTMHIRRSLRLTRSKYNFCTIGLTQMGEHVVMATWRCNSLMASLQLLCLLSINKELVVVLAIKYTSIVLPFVNIF